jgi:hypothetical protein
MNRYPDQQLLDRIRAEFEEMPGMKLTIQQVQRLCGIVERAMCELVLESLVEADFLYVKADGSYVRRTDHSSPRPAQARAHLDPMRTARHARRAS